MPQNNYIDEHIKKHGRKLDHEEKLRKKESRAPKELAKKAHKLKGIKAKLFNKKRFNDKVKMKKAIKAHEEKETDVKTKNTNKSAIPTYLMDREQNNRSKILSNMIKQKRIEKAGKWKVPIPKVKAMSEAEMFSVIKSGKRKKNAYKRMINKMTFVPENFTRKPPKLERYIRPSGLRIKKAQVTHPELKVTVCLDILSVKKNPQSALYTGLGVLTKGAVIEVNVSDLGLVTQTGKVVWSKYAQITNNPENDGVVNAILLV